MWRRCDTSGSSYDMAYASCCKSLVVCMECIHTALEQGTGNCPACNQPRMERDMYRVAGWNEALD